MSDFERRLMIWLEEHPSLARRIYDYLRFWWFNLRMPKLPGVLHWIINFLMVAATPTLAYFAYESVTKPAAALAIAILFTIYVLLSMSSRWIKIGKNTSGSAETEIWLRINELVSSVSSEATLDGNRDASIRACLGIMEGYARIITNTKAGQITVSLSLYDDKECSKMSVKYRNPGSERRIGSMKEIRYVLGHRACQHSRFPRPVADVKRFGVEACRSPTGSGAPNRAIFFIPVPQDENRDIKGFLSIGCKIPHAFQGSRTERLTVWCEPLVDHITHLI